MKEGADAALTKATSEVTQPVLLGTGTVPEGDVPASLKEKDQSGTVDKSGAKSGYYATIYDAWWTYPVDVDGDGFARSARLNWDSDVVGCYGAMDIYEVVYYRPWGSSTWYHFATGPLRTIAGCSYLDAAYIEILGGAHNYYDWRIEVYAAGYAGYDDMRSDWNDADLNDVPMETDYEDSAGHYATIYDAWWTHWIDSDGDGFARSARLVWDPDVLGCSGSMNVYEKIYYKSYTSSTWILLHTTGVHTISGCSSVDRHYLDVIATEHDFYDFRVEIYDAGYTTYDDVWSAADDTDLDDVPLEPASQDHASLYAEIADAWWTHAVDKDGDGYVRSARLNWNPNVQGCSGSMSVYEKVYYRLDSGSPWNLFHTTGAHTITGCSTTDQQYIDVYSGAHNLYDWKIEVYEVGSAGADDTLDDSNDSSLDDVAMETAAEDAAPSEDPDLVCSTATLTINARGKLKGSILVQNQGSRLATTSYLSVHFFPENSTTSTVVKRIKVPKLWPGASKLRRLNVRPPPGATWSGGSVAVIADSTSAVSETDEGNNELIYGPLP